jgi:hypothetical protein
VSLREHYNSVWRQTGKQPAALASAPELPVDGVHVWDLFLRLHNERGSNGMEANRITAKDVIDWCWFNGVESIDLWERKAIRALDMTYFRTRDNE